jgi:hypothetical protein
MKLSVSLTLRNSFQKSGKKAIRMSDHEKQRKGEILKRRGIQLPHGVQAK